MSTLLAENVPASDSFDSSTLIFVKQEVDEMIDVRNEPKPVENIPKEENKYITDQIIDKNVEVSPKENFLTPWFSRSVKTETNEDINNGTNSPVNMFSMLGVKNDLNEMKVEEETGDSHLIRHRNHHMQNENTECIKPKNEEVSEKCDHLKSMDCIHSVKAEICDNIDANKESKYIINQIEDWPKTNFSTASKFHTVEKEEREVFNSERDNIKIEEGDISEMHSSIQMERIPQKGDLSKTLNSIHSKPKIHKCDLCDYSSSRKADLQMHIKSVHLKLRNHECDFCDYKSSRKAFLQIHIKSVHLNLKNHKCDRCDYSSSQKADLEMHIKSVHLKLKNYKCHLCDYTSSWKRALQTHIRSVHLKIKNHKCDLCDFRSSQKADLQMHIKSVHLKLRNHKCDLCDYSSSQKGTLRSHIKSVHLKLKNHKCYLCDFSSSRNEHLQGHIKSVHLKQKNHKCDSCHYSTSRRRDLKSHMKSVHLKLENHKCHLCDYSSFRQGDLQMHIKSVHLKLRNHKCHLCDYSSSRKGDLQRHLKSVHATNAITSRHCKHLKSENL